MVAGINAELYTQGTLKQPNGSFQKRSCGTPERFRRWRRISMKRNNATLFLGLTWWLASRWEMKAAAITLVSYPYLGVTNLEQTAMVPDFPRNLRINV